MKWYCLAAGENSTRSQYYIPIKEKYIRAYLANYVSTLQNETRNIPNLTLLYRLIGNIGFQ